MLKTFLIVGYLEGVSLLALFLVAMPLKYAFGLPMAVKVVGWIHGILFIAYVAVLAAIRGEEGWSSKKTLAAFVASLVPFGIFVFDRSLRNEKAIVGK